MWSLRAKADVTLIFSISQSTKSVKKRGLEVLSKACVYVIACIMISMEVCTQWVNDVCVCMVGPSSVVNMSNFMVSRNDFQSVGSRIGTF